MNGRSAVVIFPLHEQCFVPLPHEGAELQQGRKPRHATLLYLFDELRFAKRIAAQAGRLHALAAQEGVDLGDDLVMSGNIHTATICQTALTYNKKCKSGLTFSDMAARAILLDSPYIMSDDEPATPAVYEALMRIKPPHLSPNAWTVKAGVSRQFFSDVKKHGNPKPETLTKVLDAIGWTVERFKAETGQYPVATEVRGAGAVGFAEMKSMVFGEEPLAPLPLYGSAQGGELGEQHDFALTELDLSEVLDYLRRPAALANDRESYALTIVGSSMSPRFKPGERVGVSPRALVEIGDDVIVQLRGENTNRVRRVLIKELVRRSASHVVLKQHNPPRELQVERSDILAIHKVKGHFL